ncbi:hypothetical protein TWF696_006822 [Orbilia brochopaga]|uniref:Endonuclease/exonuclease/phosphatase domain-containing protein n=1 Tax=Orbilia brochopaga TaxID=3140254 RepID=A0AAV9UPZ9_9PEZI
MLFSSVLSAAASAFLFSSAALVQAAPINATTGSFSVIDGAPLTFSYETSDPFSTNWIAIYPASVDPTTSDKPESAALTWKYTPDAKGTVQIDVDTLLAGPYLACFLSRGGYKPLAPPFTVTVKGDPIPFGFIVNDITLRNARQGDRYEAKIGGLIDGGAAVAFQKVSGNDWLQLSNDGTISGIPPTSYTNGTDASTIVVRATSSTGATSELKATIPVRAAGTPLVPEFRAMTFNMWLGGSQVKDSHRKQVRFIANTNVDIIGLQDTSGGHPKRLADALGWYFWSPPRSNIGTISRYPIVQGYDLVDNAATGMRVALDGDASQINFWSMHLEWTPYGPYDFCFGNMTVEQVLQREAESRRIAQVMDVLKAMDSQLVNANKAPVFLVGDANAPSHLDWTEALRSKNCGRANIPWPTSVKPTEAGLIDSFRVANPDPAAVPGTTWSPLHATNVEGGITGKPEPQDRIDFIYYKGGINVVDSKTIVVGNPKEQPQHKDNEWTTDHAAVITTFRF